MIESFHYRERRWERPCSKEWTLEQGDQLIYRELAAKRCGAQRNLEIHFVKGGRRGTISIGA
jgi:hypothetical protein